MIATKRVLMIFSVHIFSSLLLTGSFTLAEVPSLESQFTNSLTQLPSVNQLSDIQLTDWAFEALQMLKERYGCLLDYPVNIYQDSHSLTRSEFALL